MNNLTSVEEQSMKSRLKAALSWLSISRCCFLLALAEMLISHNLDRGLLWLILGMQFRKSP